MNDTDRRREIFKINLTNCLTKDDFNEISSELVLFHERRGEEELHKLIGTPEVLTCYLAHYRYRKGKIFFQNVCKYFCKLYRVDYLQCFVDYVDFSLFFRREVHGNYNYYITCVATLAPMDVATFLLDNGVDPNTEVDFYNSTMLNAACYSGKRDLVHLLIERGADVNRTFGVGVTVARLAVRCGDVRILDILIVSGLDLSLEDKDKLWESHLQGIDSYEITQRLLDMNIAPPEDVIFRLIYHNRMMKGDDTDFSHIRRTIALFRSLGYREPTDLELSKFTPQFISPIFE